jgi:hypothetical protein
MKTARTQEIGTESEEVSLISLGIRGGYNPSEDKIKFLPTDSFSLQHLYMCG